ncbi:MAG TPA: radical SAM family heme chaperone HemW [Bacteroidales bacterium]|nr:radical SAM family heme chaperone HemW [Bacteroidales bacterium]
MAGIYIHIPFCKSKCSYCDFYSKTDFSQRKELIDCLIKEIHLQKNYIDENVETIYFGGGTPSVLSSDELERILSALEANFLIEEDAEITLEANPDDLTAEYLNALKLIKINRLSIGVQSFDNKQLKAINRRHSSEAALTAVEVSKNNGFNNISIDLIFGLPEQDLASWKEQVNKAMYLDIQHLSAYGLMYEEGTPLWRKMKKGEVVPVDDETSIAMYHYLVKTCVENGFEHYEISNFAKPDFRSRHNSAYWQEKTYLGIGPSAHSYNGISRQWNILSISQYCRKINQGETFYEKEILSLQDKYNDFVMVSLRTMDGINFEILQKRFGEKMYNHCLKSAEAFINNGKLAIDKNFLRLTIDGVMTSDQIIVELMYVS